MGRPSNTLERRAQIARALLAVMARTGYDGATIADVARAGDLASGLVHYHYGSKHEILIAAVALLREDYEARLDRHIGRAAHDAESQLDAFVDAHLRLGEEADPGALACWIDVYGQALRDPRIGRLLAAAIAAATARLRGIVERGVSDGSFTCAAPDAAAAAIVSTIQGYYVIGATARASIPRGSAAPLTRRMAFALVGRSGSTHE